MVLNGLLILFRIIDSSLAFLTIWTSGVETYYIMTIFFLLFISRVIVFLGCHN